MLVRPLLERPRRLYVRRLKKSFASWQSLSKLFVILALESPIADPIQENEDSSIRVLLSSLGVRVADELRWYVLSVSLNTQPRQRLKLLHQRNS